MKSFIMLTKKNLPVLWADTEDAWRYLIYRNFTKNQRGTE